MVIHLTRKSSPNWLHYNPLAVSPTRTVFNYCFHTSDNRVGTNIPTWFQETSVRTRTKGAFLGLCQTRTGSDEREEGGEGDSKRATESPGLEREERTGARLHDWLEVLELEGWFRTLPSRLHNVPCTLVQTTKFRHTESANTHIISILHGNIDKIIKLLFVFIF